MTSDKNGIPTYIINLERRSDRKSYIEKHFNSYPEFKLYFFRAIEDSRPAVGLYKSLHGIVKIAKESDLPYVVICEDDHKFTNSYKKDLFYNYIERAKNYGADVLLGGVSWFDCGVRVEDNLYWLKNFTGTQFLIIYASFYQKILEAHFNQNDIIDRWMCSLSDNIFITVPMLSIQYDFGYSDVTPKNNEIGRVNELFRATISKWQTIKQVTAHIQKNLTNYKSPHVEGDEQLPTYIIDTTYRNDKLLRLKQQFAPRNEFYVNYVNDTDESDNIAALWKSVIQMAKNREDEVIVICDVTHEFCSGYNKNVLWDAIHQGAYLGADLVLGGTFNTQQIIPASESLCWISSFDRLPFIIIYSNFFDIILSTDFHGIESFELKLSDLTANKYVIHPFISRMVDLEFSDALIYGITNNHNNKMNFDNCSSKIDKVKSVSQMAEKKTTS